MSDPVTIAILAKAPLPGLVKTRLIAVLGADGAADLAARLIERTVATACAANVGPVTLWATPDENHVLFQRLRQRHDLTLARQPDGDLGLRMHTAMATAGGPTIVIGTDCPALETHHLRTGADALAEDDAVVIPAEDGGYVLIGLREPNKALFNRMQWGVGTVMTETRRRIRALNLSCCEIDTLWDVDTPDDLARMQRDQLLG